MRPLRTIRILTAVIVYTIMSYLSRRGEFCTKNMHETYETLYSRHRGPTFDNNISKLDKPFVSAGNACELFNFAPSAFGSSPRSFFFTCIGQQFVARSYYFLLCALENIIITHDRTNAFVSVVLSRRRFIRHRIRTRLSRL